MPAKSPKARFVTTLSRSEAATLPGESIPSEAHFVLFAGWPGEEAVCVVNDMPSRVRQRLMFHQLALPPELGEGFLGFVKRQFYRLHRNDSLEMLSAVWGSCNPNLDTIVTPSSLESGQPYVLTDVKGLSLLGVVGTDAGGQSLTMFNTRERAYPTNIVIAQTQRFMINVGATAIFPLMHNA